MSTRKKSAPLIVAALVGVLLIIGVRLIFSGVNAVASGPPDAEDCLALNVAASPDKSPLLVSLAEKYNATVPMVDGTCVHANISTKSSGPAAEALARGWDETKDGPRPDVWSPATSYWSALAEQDAVDQDKPSVMPKDHPLLVQSPLVIAMPRPMAKALGWPDKQVGWADFAALARSANGWGSKGHPEWGQFKLGKTNPHVSTFGLDATVASYYAATGVSSDLTVADVADPKTRAFVKDLESAVVHYGDTSRTFLANMSNAAAKGQGMTYVSAVTLEEKSVLDYNRGNPSGDPKTEGDQEPPAIQLAAVYPSDGTFISDHPWLTLSAPWVDAAKRQAAGDFLTWLRAPDQQRTFTDAGFRTFEGKPGDSHTVANGMIPAGAPSPMTPPSPKVLNAIQHSWDELRKPANVLFIMDVSGSMAESTGAGSRLEVAQRAALGALDEFSGSDHVGLWAFSTRLGPGDQAWQELAPISQADKAVPAMKSAISALQPWGGTGLYATLRAAQTQMLANLDPDRINAIVILTDGRNENPADNDLNGLLDQLEGESPDTTVRVFTIGYSDAADSDALGKIAEASEGRYYDAGDPATIDQVMLNVLSNF